MALFHRKKHKRNTLIIKDHVIRFVRAREPDPAAVERMEERYLPAGVIQEGRVEDIETLRQIVKECADLWNLRHDLVQYCVPDAFVSARKVDLPEEVEPEQAGAYLFMEIGDSIPVPFEDPVFDFDYAPEDRQVVLLLAPREHVDTYASLLQSIRCRPNAADISALCFYRALANAEVVDKKEHTMLLQVDLRAAVVSIFQEDKPLFVSQLSLEVEDGLWTMQAGRTDMYHPVWNGSEAEINRETAAVADEVERIMRFYRYSMRRGEDGISRIFVGGDHPFLERWLEAVKQRVDVFVHMADTAEYADIPLRFYENLGLVLKQNIQT